MTIHIWCPRPSDSAIQLRDAIRAAGVTCHKSKPNPNDRHIRNFVRRVQLGDLWLDWGPSPSLQDMGVFTTDQFATLVEITHLNSQCPMSKRDQLLALYQNGVACPEVFDSPGEGRIGRSLHHSGGRDLLRGNGRDYWVQRLNIDREFRVHVFRGKSIRAGVKVPRDGYRLERAGEVWPHPWVRSYDGGWRISYGQHHQLITTAIRDIAKRAVAALGLDFGAVDVGMCNGQPVVLEVNLAPGLEGGSVGAYVKHILEVYRG